MARAIGGPGATGSLFCPSKAAEGRGLHGPVGQEAEASKTGVPKETLGTSGCGIFNGAFVNFESMLLLQKRWVYDIVSFRDFRVFRG